VRDLARKDSSSALAQLASRMMAAMHGSAGADQFAKIKGLIRDMIAKLESEADADASEKAWCDRNLADARQRQSEKNSEIAKLTTKIDQMSAKSAQLKSQIATLQEQLAKLAGSQAEMDKLRLEEKQIFANSKAELEKGLEGLKLALKVLTEYYATSGKAHEAADGASDGIISLLEVCESDFTQELARTISDEDAAVAEYEKVTKENEIETATKNQDVKYKTKEAKGLDEDSSELSTDRGTAQSELDATQELLSKLEKRCVARAETYAQRKARHAAEIAGLKEALDILENETAFLQSAARRKLRGDRHRVSRA